MKVTLRLVLSDSNLRRLRPPFRKFPTEIGLKSKPPDLHQIELNLNLKEYFLRISDFVLFLRENLREQSPVDENKNMVSLNDWG